MSRKASKIFYVSMIVVSVIIFTISFVGIYQSLSRKNHKFLVKDSAYQTQLAQEVDKTFSELESQHQIAKDSEMLDKVFKPSYIIVGEAEFYETIGQKILFTGNKLIKARELVNNGSFDEAERYLNSARKDLKELAKFNNK